MRGASHTRSQDAVSSGGAHILTTLTAISQRVGTSGVRSLKHSPKGQRPPRGRGGAGAMPGAPVPMRGCRKESGAFPPTPPASPLLSPSLRDSPKVLSFLQSPS